MFWVTRMGTAVHGTTVRILPAVTLLAVLAACGVMQTPPPAITERISDQFAPSHLIYCFGHGCAQQHTVAFPPDEWNAVRALFAEAPADAAAERQRIRVAIGLLEGFAGAQAGTSGDRGRTMPFGYTLGPAQLDCYDETINTSNFIGLLERDGLLRYHREGAPVQRTLIDGDIIHATAVVAETATGRRFAVDSSYFDNGVAASVAPVEDWLSGWKPPEIVAAEAADN